ncbi:putative alpha/beta hydrolase family esterase [Kitasatospora sp. MAA4]|uniref:RBBP9/YdeN family alpha/beta hydrolase n=1 Tax=Kitasatospora sp. MAA4 TaxID=3035093 RepID=UPI002473645C|nr:alpha/beta hydrolase [Kitasatospora sp. MAA4]MDH6136777.1 putative alpha/beta hydrolase family esterase [Kitasatospora sp. MAA4]
MTDTTATVLIVPGYEGSGPEHWQSHWEREHPGYLRVEQADWDAPQVDEWVDTLHRAVLAQSGPVVLVAHSLGCITIAHWAARHGLPVAGALLVAPPDIDNAVNPGLRTFQPIPLRPLPFPSIVVSSSDDPWASPERSRRFAENWGARLVALGPLGHINSASDLGSWPEGQALLAELTARSA